MPKLRKKFKIEILTRNGSLNSTQLRDLKEPPISSAMVTLLEMIDNFTGEVSRETLQSPGIQVRIFRNDYPLFKDTNNLSLLIFLSIGGTFFALPGDLEKPGWLELLKKPDVRKLLGRVEVFVASHHGRESGYCRKVFDYCRPRLVVMSDAGIKYNTQEMANTYGQHASGDRFGGKWRKVITTRNDGNLWWRFS